MRIIGHIDMDAFFAAVEERDHPELAGLPIVVGADPLGGQGRGVVATANYPARAYGIHSALPISRAWRLSEQARRAGKSPVNFLAGNFKKYEQVSARVMGIVRANVAVVEQASIDEAYFEFPDGETWVAAEVAGKKMKREILANERLTCSIGLGPNKLIAKIASGFKKPAGLTMVKEAMVEKFLDPLVIREIPGIGPKTEVLFQRRGIFKIRDLKTLSQAQLQDMLGKWGNDLFYKARGIDNTPVSEDHEIKSIGEQETFAQDTLELNFIVDRLFALCQNVFNRLGKSNFNSFRTVVLTVRLADFETKTRSRTLPKPAKSLTNIKNEVLKLFLPFLDKRENPKRKLIRLIGVRLEKLST